jgi:hypothetical protein
MHAATPFGDKTPHRAPPGSAAPLLHKEPRPRYAIEIRLEKNMLKKIGSLILSTLLLQAAVVPAFAKSDANKEAERAEKIRTQLVKLGTGKDALVRLELRDKSKLEGYISEAGAESFVVTNRDGKTTTVPYPQVRKAQGNNLSTGAKIAIGAGVVAAIVLIVIWHMISVNEQ